MARTKRPTAGEVDGVEYRRTRTWQMALSQANNGSAVIFYVLVGMMSYLQNAGYGIAVAAAGILLTGTRVLDGVIDPALAVIMDKVNLKHGKLRFFMALGWAIRSLAALLLFVWGSGRGWGVGFFLVVYVIYIIGSSTNDIAGNMMGPVMTNDPKQRPVVGVWGVVYSYLTPVIFTLVSTVVILPKYGNQYTVEMLRETAIWFIAASAVFQLLAIIGISHADKPENFAHLSARDKDSVSLMDMLRFLKSNGPFQRYTIAAVADKLASQIGNQAVVSTMLYGILLGNMQLGTIISMVAMVPSLLFAIIAARYTGKHGSRKSLVAWTWVCIGCSVVMIGFCLLVNMRSVLSTLPLMIGFFTLLLVLRGSSMGVTTATGAMRADIVDYELDRSGKYLPGTVTATYNFIDQLVTSLGSTIALGSVALIGYTAVMPQPTDAPTTPILLVTVFLLFVVPLLGWVVTLLIMPGYKLTREEMIAVQRRIVDKKASLSTSEADAETALEIVRQARLSENGEGEIVEEVVSV